MWEKDIYPFKELADNMLKLSLVPQTYCKDKSCNMLYMYVSLSSS